MRVGAGAGPGFGVVAANEGEAEPRRTAATNAPQSGITFTRLVAGKDRERMTARTTGDDDLEMRLLAHVARVARTFFVAAETASRRGGSFACGLFVHGTAIYAGLALRPAEAAGTHAGRSFT